MLVTLNMPEAVPASSSGGPATAVSESGIDISPRPAPSTSSPAASTA